MSEHVILDGLRMKALRAVGDGWALHRAWDELLDRQVMVMLPILDGARLAERRRRLVAFEDLVRRLSRCPAPGPRVLSLRRVDDERGPSLLAILDDVDGVTVSKLLRRQPSLPVLRALRLAMAVCAGLGALRVQGLAPAPVTVEHVVVSLVDGREEVTVFPWPMTPGGEHCDAGAGDDADLVFAVGQLLAQLLGVQAKLAQGRPLCVAPEVELVLRCCLSPRHELRPKTLEVLRETLRVLYDELDLPPTMTRPAAVPHANSEGAELTPTIELTSSQASRSAIAGDGSLPSASASLMGVRDPRVPRHITMEGVSIHDEHTASARC